jgi:hypothetical protein
MSARLTTSAAIPIVHTIAILDEKADEQPDHSENDRQNS